jgi:hypothetical protein
VHQPQDALALALVDPQEPHQPRARALDEIFARLGHPAGGGRAVHAVQRAELVDAEAVDHALAQEQPVAVGQRVERPLKGLLEGGPVALFEERELGVGARRLLLEQPVVVRGRLVLESTVQLERRPHRAHPQPGPQLAPPCVLADAG